MRKFTFTATIVLIPFIAVSFFLSGFFFLPALTLTLPKEIKSKYRKLSQSHRYLNPIPRTPYLCPLNNCML